MGLLYVFPVSLEETDFVTINDQSMTLKTYGLPYIFWGYATAVIAVIFFMFLAIKAPVLKLVAVGDDVDAWLGYSLLSFIGSLPLFIFSFFFYEKRIVKKEKLLTLEYRIFGIKVFSESFVPADADAMTVAPYLTSPNLARIKASEETAGFQNKGYFTLKLKTKDGKNILIDRHSRKADLVKLENLIRMIP